MPKSSSFFFFYQKTDPMFLYMCNCVLLTQVEYKKMVTHGNRMYVTVFEVTVGNKVMIRKIKVLIGNVCLCCPL